jgi:uncharacterized protein (UPF0276 family)
MASPLVGLLYNPTAAPVIAQAGNLVDYVEVIPDRLWYDFGPAAVPRFRRVDNLVEDLRDAIGGRTTAGHGIGLSLPSDLALDDAMLAEVAWFVREFGFAWYSEHLSAFLVPGRAVPNAQAGLGLPVQLSAESLALVANKVRKLQAVFGVPILLENGAIFAPIPEMEMDEPEFFNRLWEDTGCEVLLDLHNLHVNAVNLGIDARAYIEALRPEAVGEIHVAGGDWLQQFYTDSHSRPTPDQVWELAHDYAPTFPSLRAITFEWHESYFDRLGVDGIAHELETMRAIALRC